MKRGVVISIIIILIAALFSACNYAPQVPVLTPAPTVTPSKTPVITLPPTVAPTATPTIEYKSVVNPNQPYSYELMMEDCIELQAMYGDLIQLDSIGKSVEGRDLVLIKLGKGKIKIVLAGTHHAREYITTSFLMETVDEYARAYVTTGNYNGYDIKSLLDSVTLYIVPMVNPDGVNLVLYGPDATKNPDKVRSMRMLKDSYSEWKANINGVDLNRQYPCYWEEKASNTDVPSSEMYKGTAPATEPEVQAMIRLCNENDFALAASFHSKGEVIYWADSGTVDSIQAGGSMAESLAEVTGYKLMGVSQDPAVYGAGFENWFRQEFLRPAFCVELTPVGNGSTPHDDSRFDELVWQKANRLVAVIMQLAIDSK